MIMKLVWRLEFLNKIDFLYLDRMNVQLLVTSLFLAAKSIIGGRVCTDGKTM